MTDKLEKVVAYFVTQYLTKLTRDEKKNLITYFENNNTASTKKLGSKLEAFIKKEVKQISRKVLGPKQKVSYLCLDTAYKRTDIEFDGKKVSWYYSHQLQASTNGVVSHKNSIGRVLRIQLYQPSFPNRNIDDNTKRISILIDEFNHVAFLTSSTRKYHFLTKAYVTFDTANEDHLDLQTEAFNDGILEFEKPIVMPTTLTLSFGSPLADITIYNDVGTGTVTSYGATTEITTSAVHNIVTSGLVYITGFTTDTPSYDNSTINNPFGLTATVTSTTTFTIAIDTSSGSVSWITNQPVNLVYSPHRMIFPMEITYID